MRIWLAIAICLNAATAQAGLFWDAAVARHGKLMALCAAFVGGMPVPEMRAAAVAPGPLPDEVRFAPGPERDVITFMAVTYEMDHSGSVRWCKVLDTQPEPGDGAAYMMTEAYRAWRHSATRDGAGFDPGARPSEVVFGAKDAGTVRVVFGFGDTGATLALGLLLWMSPHATPLAPPKNTATP